MGLDMYLNARDKKDSKDVGFIMFEFLDDSVNDEKNVVSEEGDGSIRLAYWRKFRYLNSFMEYMHCKKYKKYLDNCEDYFLTQREIKEVIAYLEEESEDRCEYTIKAFKKALRLKRKGKIIVYNYWE